MSKLPQLNLRIPEQHHDVIRQIAQRLRERGGDDFGARLTYFLHDQPTPGPLGHVGIDVVDAMHTRVADLETKLAALQDVVAVALATPAPDPEVVQVRPRKNDPFPEAVLIEADKLNRLGVTWEDIRDRLKLKQTSNGLRNAVKHWRQRQDREWASAVEA